MCNNPNTRLLLRLIIDFVILIAVACVALIILPQTLRTQQRGFFCSDVTIRYPYKTTLLNMVHITILVVAGPAAVILIVESLSSAFRPTETATTAGAGAGASTSATTMQHFTFVGIGIPTFISECYKICGVYLFGLALAMTTLRVTQYHTGRLRPYFIDVCHPEMDDGSSCDFAESSNHSRYIEEYRCSELAGVSPEIFASLRHSFPSGFAATASYAMLFLVFYLQARLVAHHFRLLRFTLQFVFLTIAAAVAIERVYTFRNHWTDALAGIGLGCIFASFTAICILNLLSCGELKVPKRSLREVDDRRIYGYYSVNRSFAKYA